MGLYSSCKVSKNAWLFVFPSILVMFVGTCASRLNWVQCQKINVPKFGHNFNQWYRFVYEIVFIMLGIIWRPIYFSFHGDIICYDCLAGMCAKWLYSGRNGYFVSEYFGTMNGQWVYLRVHTLLQLFLFWHCLQFTHPTHAPVKQSEEVRHQSKGKWTGFPVISNLMNTNPG